MECFINSSIKVGHLYCRISVGIVVSNYRRILCSKVANKVSEFQVECGSNPSSDRIPTVDDQPY